MKIIKLLLVGMITFLTLGCRNSDSMNFGGLEQQTAFLNKAYLNSYAKDYAVLVEKYKYSTEHVKETSEYEDDIKRLKLKYHVAYTKDVTSNDNRIYPELYKVIANSTNSYEDVIVNLENYRQYTNVSPSNYLVASILIETLKLEKQNVSNNFSGKASPQAKCSASTIGGLISGAVTGCGAGAWGGPAGCVVGGTFGAIGGALLGWGSNPDC